MAVARGRAQHPAGSWTAIGCRRTRPQALRYGAACTAAKHFDKCSLPYIAFFNQWLLPCDYSCWDKALLSSSFQLNNNLRDGLEGVSVVHKDKLKSTTSRQRKKDMDASCKFYFVRFTVYKHSPIPWFHSLGIPTIVKKQKTKDVLNEECLGFFRRNDAQSLQFPTKFRQAMICCPVLCCTQLCNLFESYRIKRTIQ